jgi:hypothetical protein
MDVDRITFASPPLTKGIGRTLSGFLYWNTHFVDGYIGSRRRDMPKGDKRIDRI